MRLVCITLLSAGLRNKEGWGVSTLKTPYRDGTTHIILSPLEFMQRLAALVPRPRLNLIRFHGVLAPNAKLRAEIIPGSKKNKRALCDLEWVKKLSRKIHFNCWQRNENTNAKPTRRFPVNRSFIKGYFYEKK